MANLPTLDMDSPPIDYSPQTTDGQVEVESGSTADGETLQAEDIGTTQEQFQPSTRRRQVSSQSREDQRSYSRSGEVAGRLRKQVKPPQRLF